MNTDMSISTTEIESRSFISKVYGWMSLGLALTAWVSWWVAGSPALLQFLVLNRVVFIGLIIGELALVVALSRWVHGMTAGAATMAFVTYAAFNGVTLSVIFLAYTASSIASTFVVTAATFGAMSFYGAVTKRDLTSMGHLLFMALIGMVIASVVNIFMKNDTLSLITSGIGVLVFTGLTAYDTQRIKAMVGMDGGEEERKQAILGALMLYLDFVNLFLSLLRFTGKRR